MRALITAIGEEVKKVARNIATTRGGDEVKIVTLTFEDGYKIAVRDTDTAFIFASYLRPGDKISFTATSISARRWMPEEGEREITTYYYEGVTFLFDEPRKYKDVKHNHRRRVMGLGAKQEKRQKMIEPAKIIKPLSAIGREDLEFKRVKPAPPSCKPITGSGQFTLPDATEKNVGHTKF